MYQLSELPWDSPGHSMYSPSHMQQKKKDFRCVLSEAGENILCAHISIYNCCILGISKQSILWSNGMQPPLASLIPARVSDSDSPQPNLELQLLILCKPGTSSGSALQFCAQWGRLDPGSPGCIISICQSTPNTLFLRMGAQWAQPTQHPLFLESPPSAQTERPPIAQWLGTPSTLNSPPSLSHFTNIT